MSTVPQSCIGDSILRQIRVGPTWTKAWWSSVISGADQLRWTEFPLRTALRSLTGRANSSDGGSGIPGVPQLESNPTQATPSANVRFVSFICRERLTLRVTRNIRGGAGHSPPESTLKRVSTNDGELENI